MSVGSEAGTGPARAVGSARIDVPGACALRIERPSEVAELAALLADHHAKNEAVLVCGGRTRLSFANRARPLAAAISLDALGGVDVFEPDEGVVHALAGTPIRALQQTVAAEGWELPLDPPGEAATVGGTIASAAMGPRAQAFGRVADAVLGLELVGADGTPSKCGGRVVKNVTGYDMAKLYTGSFGSLGVVAGAWLRLRPQPAQRAVLTSRVARDGASFEGARARARCASARAFVWNESPADREAELLVELGSGEAGLRHDHEALARDFELAAAAPDAVDRLRDARAHAASRHPIGLRARVLGARLGELREALLAAGFELSIDLGLGVLTARGGEAPIAVHELLGLRERAIACGGHASFEWLPAAGFDGIDVFGEAPGTRALASALKARFDPRGILNPGRFVMGS